MRLIEFTAASSILVSAGIVIVALVPLLILRRLFPVKRDYHMLCVGVGIGSTITATAIFVINHI